VRQQQLEASAMKAKLFLTAALMAAFVSPTFAATTYYVVQNNKSHKCSVSTSKPSATSKTVTLIPSDSTGYKTKKDATDAMTAADACKAAT
jgi:hypothetical protein